MSQQVDQVAAEGAPEIELEGGTYEIIRNRLVSHAKELRSRLDKLNAGRKEVFGSIDTTLLSTERITTDHNCVPRDMVAIGNRFIFGYNVHFGLKTETDLSDVFSVYEFSDDTFHEQPLDLLGDERFQRDFREVYRYYKNAVFSKFFVTGPHVYMTFQVGKATTDIKTFKWAVDGDSLVYIDNRSDHEVRFPPQHEFEWTRTHRDLHQGGQHPHISIEDRVFVETVGGDLTIKIEDNTDSGEGLYSEDVDDPDQTLDDAEIYYAIVGNIILLKIRPYQEEKFRYIAYNEKVQQARRIDSIAGACVLLPDDHGLIFSNGYYLQNGEHKTFDSALGDMLFERRIASPNGEDFLYIFYNTESGVYVLLRYNLIEQHVETPIICHGATLFDDGHLVCFKSHDDPQKHHAVQLWQTPYVGEEFVPETNTDSFLYKIGNRDIVRGMAECHEVLNLIDKEDTYANLYVDMVKLTTDIMDSYFWLDRDETFHLKGAVGDIREAAAAAVEEYDKVVRVKQSTRDQTRKVETETRDAINSIYRRRFDKIDDFVQVLGDLRRIRGELISLRDLRYVDTQLVESLEGETVEQSDNVAQRCVEFLLRPDALASYQTRAQEQTGRIEGLTKVSDAKTLEEEIGQGADDLEMLIEVVSNLKIDDATHRTQIIDNISTIFSQLNAARAGLKTKTKELMSVEGVAEFNSQMKLLNQGVVNYLDICDTPEKCEEFLTKVMIQLEELEGRFAEFDEFVLQLTEKREEVYNAFETRKLSLVEARNKRANTLMSAADRILKGIKSRVESFEEVNDINGYFASDLMIEKIRDIVGELGDLDDTVKVDDIQSRMKTIREDAVRQLKDRQDLYVDGENVIKLGQHQFSVNVQALDLTTVLRDDEMQLHLSGTRFFEAIDDSEMTAMKDLWQQEVPSENREIYRGEYLAYQVMTHLRHQPTELSELLAGEYEDLAAYVQRFMGPRYSEGYAKGVHDQDASKILQQLMKMYSQVDLLRFHSKARALASLYWNHCVERKGKTLVEAKLKGFGDVSALFPDVSRQRDYIDELRHRIASFVQETSVSDERFVDEAGEYLFYELTQTNSGFCISQTAFDLWEAFQTHLRANSFVERFDASVKAVHQDALTTFSLIGDWVNAFLQHRGDEHEAEYAEELAVLLMRKRVDVSRVIGATVHAELSGLLGAHAVVQSGKYDLHYNEFMTRLADYEKNIVPRFQRYIELKKECVDQARDEMRLDEFKPRVLTSFVRNKLIDSVYLPIIGDNLAKQVGVVGEAKRTDLMGMLLLISPPGYGKTTLMEYVANRLGVIFMKINGPAIGHHVTSLDPNEAPNAGAREEVEKLNLALEMGDNVMLYVDDIQHCNPEFLQKFISLCDAQRKIEGVYKGRTRTYDLRGRKVVVVMAGNPYTESGEKFQIPDMLSNRADVYNLGEIIGDSADAFEMSYLENSLTSNPVLNKLASRSQQDVYSIIRMAETGSREGIELEGNFSLEEVNEMTNVMTKLMRVRDVILRVNRQYIQSAAQADEYRTEPPFKLQGSYRNMNRIAEKVVAIMNDEELDRLILSNYENDAQTLTSDTESNLLKVRELMGLLTDEEKQRWESIKRTFSQNVKLMGVEADDKIGQVVMQMGSFTDGLHAIRDAMLEGVQQLAEQEPIKDDVPDEVAARLSDLKSGLELIGTRISEAVDKLGQAPNLPQPVQQPAIDGSANAQAAEAMQSLADELRALTVAAVPMDPDRPIHRVSVMHKVPRSILEVMESQFKVMQDWLEPLTQATQGHSGEIQSLRQSLEECVANYALLLKDLQSARTRQGGDEST